MNCVKESFFVVNIPTNILKQLLLNVSLNKIPLITLAIQLVTTCTCGISLMHGDYC